jgi:sugar (pentulose or hexulose) kinase
MIFLGIDVGTTGAKALAVDEAGRVLGRGYREYGLEFPQPGWVTQDAAAWWRACVEAVRAALTGADARQVAAIGLSTQGATMLPVDAGGRPLCPSLTWMDRRAQRESDELVAALGEEALYRKAGWPPAPWLDAPKIAWLRRNQPELFKSAALFVSTLEFMNFRLTGRWAIDPTNAAIRQLMDIRTGRWDEEILDFLGLDEARLPEILPSGACLGELTAQAAQLLGLPRVKVYNGAHDQYCAAMGSGVHGPGELLLATGTTWVTLGVTGEPSENSSPSRRVKA